MRLMESARNLTKGLGSLARRLRPVMTMDRWMILSFGLFILSGVVVSLGSLAYFVEWIGVYVLVALLLFGWALSWLAFLAHGWFFHSFSDSLMGLYDSNREITEELFRKLMSTKEALGSYDDSDIVSLARYYRDYYESNEEEE